MQDYANTAAGSAAPQMTLIGEAQTGLECSHELHSLIDELERRIFMPAPREVGDGVKGGEAQGIPSALEFALRNSRQRVESANRRIRSILDRL